MVNGGVAHERHVRDDSPDTTHGGTVDRRDGRRRRQRRRAEQGAPDAEAGDGVGDINGVAAQLDYLERLGIDSIWFSPIMVSPMADHGYDVSDPRDIDPLFGDLGAFEGLIASAHKRGIKITMLLLQAR